MKWLSFPRAGCRLAALCWVGPVAVWGAGLLLAGHFIWWWLLGVAPAAGLLGAVWLLTGPAHSRPARRHTVAGVIVNVLLLAVLVLLLATGEPVTPPYLLST